MSKVTGFIVGTIEIAVGVLTGNPALIISGSLMIVSQAITDLTMKSPARQASEMTIQLGEQPRGALFGTSFTAGSLVDAFDFGGKYGTDWEALVIRLADHKCDSLVQFKVNDTFYDYTGDGNVSAFNSHKGTDQLHIYFRADTSVDTLPTELTDNWPGWASTDTGQSGCDVIILYRADKPNVKHPVWPGGRPTFGFVVKGKLCYDPRLDDTVGGTGDHRWADPSTWEWSENPAVCRYNWARGIYANDQVDDPTQLLIGRGLSAAEAPPANIFAAANLCDETVGAGVRYRVAGPVYANQQFLEVEEMFAAATGGSVVTHEGSVELEPGASKSVVASFTDDDLLSGSSVSWNEAILSDSDEGWINTVVANYVEPTQQWNDHDAPVVRNTDDIIADGGPRESTLTLRLVKDVAQAQRVAEINRRLGRLWGRGQVTLGPRFCETEEGDWVQWTSARRFGGDTRTFRVEAYSIDEKWQNTLTLREINADVFGDATAFEPDYSVVTINPTPPDVGEPEGSQWALAAVTLTSGSVKVPALEITGDASDDETAEAIVFEYWKSDGVINPITNPDDPPWVMEGSHSHDTTQVDITAVEGSTTYYVAVTYVVSGELGDRLVLGPVTTAAGGPSGSITLSGYTQNTGKVLGRATASTGAIEELSRSQVLDLADAGSQGDILYRGASAWARLAAGTSGKFLKSQGASADPMWDTPSGGGGSGGLYSSVLSVTPTAAITGLSNLVGTGAATTDTAVGQHFVGTSGPVGGKTTSVPATPYSFTALLAGSSKNCTPSIGWTDGTKYQFMYVNAGPINVQNNSTLSTFASTAASAIGAGYPVRLIWFKIRDDGTNVTYSVSLDGVYFEPIYTVAKSAGYLGSTGYTHVFVGNTSGVATANDVTIMSWAQGV